MTLGLYIKSKLQDYNEQAVNWIDWVGSLPQKNSFLSLHFFWVRSWCWYRSYS